MKKIVLACLIINWLISACAPQDIAAVPMGGVRAWIDHPREGDQFFMGEVVPIRWHASAPEGIQLVEVLINGETLNLATDFDHAASIVTMQHAWTPPAPGNYLLEVIATSNRGTLSQPSANVITILAAAPPTLAPPTFTDTIPAPVIATETQQASTATATETTQPTPTDTPQPPTWTNTVVVKPPTRTPTRTPKPPTPDTFGPPKPEVIYPKDNVIVACPGKVLLQWEAPNDPSGIASYQVELYISHNNGASWQMIKKWTAITAKELDVKNETDCGNMYAWKIFARDGAGNLGAYELVQFRTGLP